MNKPQLIIVVLVALICSATTFSGEVKEYMESVMLAEDREEQLPSVSSEIEPVQWQNYLPTEKKPQRVVGNAALWIVYNANTVSGWSWTGYSKVSLDQEFRASRWKFGLIGGELELMRYIHDPYLRRMHDDEDLGMHYNGVIGMHWMKEF